MIMIMENQEMQDSDSSLPVLARFDRLDRLLQLLEEKHSLCKTGVLQETNKHQEEEDKCKTLSSALNEVQHKGTLIERLAMLENRVLQLSQDMDERSTSKSSSEKLNHSSKSSTEQEKEENMMPQGIQCPISAKNEDSTKTCDLEQKSHHDTNRRQSTKKSYKKWLGWLRLGC